MWVPAIGTGMTRQAAFTRRISICEIPKTASRMAVSEQSC